MLLKKGDIVLTRGYTVISRAIRFFQKNKGEDKSKVNHTGIIINDADIKNANLIEALVKVKCHKLIDEYGDTKDKVAIFRRRDLSEEKRWIITNKAYSYVGKKYGVVKIVGHALDWCFGGKYVFRKMFRMDDYPICSWVVAYAYDVFKIKFNGVEPWACQPDDIWDECTYGTKYECIYELDYLKKV
jgi:hypothetical protein